jgi:trans-aconitate methyltransferase
MTTEARFDRYAEEYDRALSYSLSPFGEDKTYFARGRIAWLEHCLKPLAARPRSVMDFGCGIGIATPFLLTILQPQSLLGVDVSRKSIEIASKTYSAQEVRFLDFDDYQPVQDIDLVFCNGVFHHIPVGERSSALSYVFRSLRPGGLFALWENNPWNPGTRYSMSRCAFDKDAVTLTSSQSRQMLRAAGFKVLQTDFLFIFPRFLRWLRWIEPLACTLPLGTQYQILSVRP